MQLKNPALLPNAWPRAVFHRQAELFLRRYSAFEERELVGRQGGSCREPAKSVYVWTRLHKSCDRDRAVCLQCRDAATRLFRA